MNALHDRELRDRELRDRETRDTQTRDRETRDRDQDSYRESVSDYRAQRSAYREADSEREISLGTGTILSIFFALALLCAVFFGFGYSIGRKSAPAASVAAETSVSGGLFGSFKPSAGDPLSISASQRKEAPEAAPEAGTASSHASEEAPTPKAVRSTMGQQANHESSPDPSSVSVAVKPTMKTARSAPDATAPAAPIATAMPATNPNGTAMVQVAAVSHQEDADLLLSALKRRGYEVLVRHEAQDELMHVQVGPFASRKDADVMRQRLLSDGYNAIVK